MILIELQGGLGNQMFQYAAGYSLAIKFGKRLVIDPSKLEQQPRARHVVKRNLELDQFRISEEIKKISNKKILRPPFTVKRKIKYFLYHNFSKDNVFLRISEYEDKSSFFLASRYNLLLDGFFQSERYFSEHQESIRSQFEPKGSLGEANEAIQHQMNREESVAVHFRRGDYTYTPQMKHHGLLPLNFYSNAINHLKSKIQIDRLYVFSDEPDWVRMNFHKVTNEVPFQVVDINRKTEDAYKDLLLMSKAKHNIIANSSFSWWSAWLNDYPRKVVVAPNKWFANEKRNHEKSDIVPARWKKI